MTERFHAACFVLLLACLVPLSLRAESVDTARRNGAYLPYKANTAYCNTIPAHLEPPFPGDRTLERRIQGMEKWLENPELLPAVDQDLTTKHPSLVSSLQATTGSRFWQTSRSIMRHPSLTQNGSGNTEAAVTDPFTWKTGRSASTFLLSTVVRT